MTTFLRKNYLTWRRAEALEILGSERLSLEVFVGKMWPLGVSLGFGKYFLRGLEGLGLVEKSVQEGAETYQLTEEARGILVQPPWKCRYCGAHKWAQGITLCHRPCRACAKSHLACKDCEKTRMVACGDFPDFQVGLRDCPSGGKP